MVDGRRLLLLALSSCTTAVLCSLVRPWAACRGLRRLRMCTPTPLLHAARKAQSVCGCGTADSPRVAPDEERALAILRAWEADMDLCEACERGVRLGTETCEYGSGVKLYGRLVWAEGARAGERRPGVLLVHTAVGPRDLFLFWRAEALAALGYVVLIADCLGDQCGKGWDPEWTIPVRERLMADRHLLRQRMVDAFETLAASDRVDSTMIAACGYCFGGRAVLDLAKADPNGLQLVVSFHGVVDAEPPPAGVERIRSRVLLFHGDADPFVPADTLSASVQQLRDLHAPFELHAYGGVKHGFTNPAQDLNPSPAFAYNVVAADSSWHMTKHALASMQSMRPA